MFVCINNKKIAGAICSIVVIFAAVFIMHYKLVDYHNLYEETLIVKMAEESTTYPFDVNKDTNLYLNLIKANGIDIENENEKVMLNLCDRYGYLIYSGTFDTENGYVLHPQAKLKANEDYTIEISVQNISADMEITLSYYGYTEIPDFIKILVLLIAVITLVVIYLVCTKSLVYVKWKNGIIQVFNRNTAPQIWEYGLWLGLFLIPFVTLMDGDTRAFVHYEVNFWKSIKEGGGIRYFYEFSNRMIDYYRSNNIGGAFEVIYDFPVYFFLGIWGFPLWLVCSVFHLEEVSHFGTLLYGKSIYLFFLPIVACLVYKVCKNIGVSEKNSKWAAFLFLSSITVFVDIGVMGQLDIIGMPFTLLGIYYFQKRCRWKFIVFFAIAVSFKQFPLFIFFPLLLLVEKRVTRIIADLFLVVGFTFMANVPFPKNTVAMQIKGAIRERFLEILLGAKLPVYNGLVPVIVIFMGMICIYCYLKKVEQQEEIDQHSVFIPLISMFVVLSTFDSNPYWFIHLAPFLAMIIVYNSKHFNTLILFETVGMICLILNQFHTNYWCFDSDTGEGMLLDIIFGKPDSYLTIERLLPYFRLDRYSPVCYAGYLLAISTILYLSRPGHMEQEDTPVRWQALFRLVLNTGISVIPAFLYVVSVMVF